MTDLSTNDTGSDVLAGYQVQDDDDPVPLSGDGSPVDTWREDSRTTSGWPGRSTTEPSGCSRSSC